MAVGLAVVGALAIVAAIVPWGIRAPLSAPGC